MTPATKLRTVRQAAGLSQAELAARAGLRRATITAIESGAADPLLSTLHKIADALGCPVSDLV